MSGERQGMPGESQEVKSQSELDIGGRETCSYRLTNKTYVCVDSAKHIYLLFPCLCRGMLEPMVGNSERLFVTTQIIFIK